jgi:RimJ/RimL family protein N-acetyltransferase
MILGSAIEIIQKPRPLIGSRIVLEPWTIENAKQVSYVATVRDREFMRYAGSALRPQTIRSIGAFNRSRAEGLHIRYSIHLRDGNAFVGVAELLNIDLHNLNAEFGGLIVREHEGKGYYQEMGQLLFGLAFNDLGLVRVYARTANPAGMITNLALGMKKEAHLRNHSLCFGVGLTDSVVFGILREDYLELECSRKNDSR